MTDPRIDPAPRGRELRIEKRIMPNFDGGRDRDSYAYTRDGDVATLRVDLSCFADPENAADKLLTACDELAGMLYDQEKTQ